jgi:flagellar motor switch protein FliG
VVVTALDKDLTGQQKAALLLVALGPELSGLVLKNFRDDEIERITAEIFRVGQISPEQREKIIEEFYQTAMVQGYASSGGIEYARAMLEKAVGAQKARELVNRLVADHSAAPFSFLRDLEAPQVVTFLRHEHPQTIALVLSFLGSDKAAAVIAGLSPALQAEVAVRIATLDRASADVIADIEQIMRERLAALIQPNRARQTQQSGGVDQLVKMLKEVDRSTEKTIIDSLESIEPRLADDIKKKMFVFENITMLDDRSIQRVLREVDIKDLSMAMRGSSEDVRQRIFANMSERAVQMLQEDMASSGPVRLRNVEEAQSRIVNTIRRLEDAEEIVIARGGEDDVLV